MTSSMLDATVRPTTAAGERFRALADRHALDFAERAPAHDREGSFPFQNWDDMRESGFLAAMVPEEFGGLGVTSLVDLAAALARLGRGDGSTTIGVNMHFASSWSMTRAWRRGGTAADAIAPLLGLIASGEAVFCTAGTEPGTAVSTHPLTQGTRVEGGVRIRGRKIFATNSPVATWFWVVFRIQDDDGNWQVGAAVLPRDTPGVVVNDDWDALGMRASGSGSMTFDCVVPTEAVTTSGPVGVLTDFGLQLSVFGQVGLLAAFLGIGEHARDLAVEAVTKRRRHPEGPVWADVPGIQHLVAEMDVDLSICRAVVERTARLADEVFAGDAARPELEALAKEFQATKLTVNRKAIDVVDRALTASGGAGYMRGHPLERLYRDVRAGPFMQPFSVPEAMGVIGRLALGRDPLEGL